VREKKEVVNGSKEKEESNKEESGKEEKEIVLHRHEDKKEPAINSGLLIFYFIYSITKSQ